MPGPAPNPNARRRNARPDGMKLPAGGRPGDPPAWPLPRPTKPERALWAELWATPQAAAWESLGWIRIVARYARLTVQAEKRGALTTLLGEVRQLEDRLGLNPMSMRRLMWTIVDAPMSQEPADRADNVTDIAEYQERFG